MMWDLNGGSRSPQPPMRMPSPGFPVPKVAATVGSNGTHTRSTSESHLQVPNRSTSYVAFPSTEHSEYRSTARPTHQTHLMSSPSPVIHHAGKHHSSRSHSRHRSHSHSRPPPSPSPIQTSMAYPVISYPQTPRGRSNSYSRASPGPIPITPSATYPMGIAQPYPQDPRGRVNSHSRPSPSPIPFTPSASYPVGVPQSAHVYLQDPRGRSNSHSRLSPAPMPFTPSANYPMPVPQSAHLYPQGPRGRSNSNSRLLPAPTPITPSASYPMGASPSAQLYPQAPRGRSRSHSRNSPAPTFPLTPSATYPMGFPQSGQPQQIIIHHSQHHKKKKKHGHHHSTSQSQNQVVVQTYQPQQQASSAHQQPQVKYTYGRGRTSSQPPPFRPYSSLPALTDARFRYSRCTGRRKGLCIGVNYRGQPHELRGCVNDAKHVYDFLIRRGRFRPEDIVLLTDDSNEPGQLPTRQNILDAMHWLVRSARADDSLFFHYSGHGGQTPDLDGDEIDGWDEVIYPMDFQQTGHIVDDEMHDIMVKPLPAGCRLTGLFDCCHSGTALDLSYVYSSHGRMKGSQVSDRARRRKATPADVISWSGCQDGQTSSDTFAGGMAVGAMSHAFVTALTNKPNQTYQELLRSIRLILSPRFSQKPQLGSSHHIDTNLQFIF